MKVRILLVVMGCALVGQSKAWAECTGQVYHVVGPALFTNAAAWGYADGQVAGSNFLCGVYAGTNTNSLAPWFGLPGSCLKRSFIATGCAGLWGRVVLEAPAGTPILIQFRAWPAEFGTYEEAVASGIPSPPVGVSEIVPAIPDNLIVEFPIQTGLLWLSPLPRLSCTLTADSVMLSWPTNAGGFMLMAGGSLVADAGWSPAGGTIVVSNGHNVVSLPLTNAVRFFRLRR